MAILYVATWCAFSAHATSANMLARENKNNILMNLNQINRF